MGSSCGQRYQSYSFVWRRRGARATGILNAVRIQRAHEEHLAPPSAWEWLEHQVENDRVWGMDTPCDKHCGEHAERERVRPVA